MLQRISRNLIALYNTTASLNFLGVYPVFFSLAGALIKTGAAEKIADVIVKKLGERFG